MKSRKVGESAKAIMLGMIREQVVTQGLRPCASSLFLLYEGAGEFLRTRRTAQRRSSEAALVLLPYPASHSVLSTITVGFNSPSYEGKSLGERTRKERVEYPRVLIP